MRTTDISSCQIQILYLQRNKTAIWYGITLFLSEFFLYTGLIQPISGQVMNIKIDFLRKLTMLSICFLQTMVARVRSSAFVPSTSVQLVILQVTTPERVVLYKSTWPAGAGRFSSPIF